MKGIWRVQFYRLWVSFGKFLIWIEFVWKSYNRGNSKETHSLVFFSHSFSTGRLQNRFLIFNSGSLTFHAISFTQPLNTKHFTFSLIPWSTKLAYGSRVKITSELLAMATLFQTCFRWLWSLLHFFPKKFNQRFWLVISWLVVEPNSIPQEFSRDKLDHQLWTLQTNHVKLTQFLHPWKESMIARDAGEVFLPRFGVGLQSPFWMSSTIKPKRRRLIGWVDRGWSGDIQRLATDWLGKLSETLVFQWWWLTVEIYLAKVLDSGGDSAVSAKSKLVHGDIY